MIGLDLVPSLGFERRHWALGSADDRLFAKTGFRVYVTDRLTLTFSPVTFASDAGWIKSLQSNKTTHHGYHDQVPGRSRLCPYRLGLARVLEADGSGDGSFAHGRDKLDGLHPG